jgi:hypothetical protein
LPGFPIKGIFDASWPQLVWVLLATFLLPDSFHAAEFGPGVLAITSIARPLAEVIALMSFSK